MPLNQQISVHWRAFMSLTHMPFTLNSYSLVPSIYLCICIPLPEGLSKRLTARL